MSAPDATKIESSDGCHSMEVTGARCQLNDATGAGSEAVDLRNTKGLEAWVSENASSFQHMAVMENLPLLFDVSEVPRFDFAFVASTKEQIGGQLVPTDDINIRLMCPANRGRAFFAFYSDIPDLNGLVG